MTADYREALPDGGVGALDALHLLAIWVMVSPLLLCWGVVLYADPNRRDGARGLVTTGLLGLAIGAAFVGVVVFGGTALVEVVVG